MGSSRPEADAEILLLTNSLMQTAGLKKFAFRVGHIGVLRGILTQEKLVDKVQSAVMQLMDKKQYEDAFRLVESAGVSETCILTLRKLVELKGNNVLDVVDRVAELVGDYEKSVEASRNLREILELVLKSRCDVDMTVDAGFARGLEYYTGMILEVYVPDMDIALGGGGRYDRLIELFGGDPTPAVGVAHGVDRLMLALQEQMAAQRTLRETEEGRVVLVVPIKEELRGEALRVSQMLRNAGVSVELEIMGRKMAKALEDADRRKMSYAVIIGERELKEGPVVVRNLAKRVQNTVKIEDVLEAVKS
jgi:histidyl-tRNA synthetase